MKFINSVCGLSYYNFCTSWISIGDVQGQGETVRESVYEVVGNQSLADTGTTTNELFGNDFPSP